MSKEELNCIRRLVWAGMTKRNLNRNKFGNMLQADGVCSKQSLYELLRGKEIGCDKLAAIFKELNIVIKLKR